VTAEVSALNEGWLRRLIPQPWEPLLRDCDAVERVEAFLDGELAAGRAWQPDASRIFRALSLTSPEEVRAVATAQDPYPGLGVPTGLAFSVPAGERLPQSLRNIFREYQDDLGLPQPAGGDLTWWARSGVLLLNVALTCEPGKAGSHARCGWHEVTGHLLRRLADDRAGIVFLAWGKPALKVVSKLPLEDHQVIESVHPSPLSARRGWFGSRPFSRCNEALAEMGEGPINWQLP